MQREQWKSKLGFILASSGAAVGLGNIQRFPYMVSQFGGAAFVFVYLLCVLLIGLPLMLVEFSIGRHAQKNPIDAIKKICPKGSWKLVGALGILTAFFILSYYLVAASWTLSYVIQMLRGEYHPLSAIAANLWTVIGYMALFQLIVILVVKKGLKKGIERYSKILMPLLVVLLLALVVRALTLPGSYEGLRYYLLPDWSQINSKVVLYALSQAFFSLCIGEAVLITYGSYTTKKDNLVESACYIACFDTLIAVFSGLILFPALFAFGKSPDQGVGLIYNVMPEIFLQLPFGSILGVGFFMILAFAAFTTSIALLEIPVGYLVESKGWSRNSAAWGVGGAVFACAIPSALSKGANVFLTEVQLPFIQEVGVYDIMDFLWGALAMVVGGFFLCIFAGWVWGADRAADELSQGCPSFSSWLGKLWQFVIKYMAPFIILCVFISLFY